MKAPIPYRGNKIETPSEVLGVGELESNDGNGRVIKGFRFFNQGILTYLGSNR